MLLWNTNILMYKTETENVYKDCYKDKQLLDFSNYPKDLKYYSDANDLVVGKIKYEKCRGVPVKAFVGLRSKMYTFITEDNHEFKEEKVIYEKFFDEELKYKQYTNVLFNRSYMKYKMNKIQNKNHNIGFYKINKASLSFYYNKNCIIKDRYSSLLRFHISTS